MGAHQQQQLNLNPSLHNMQGQLPNQMGSGQNHQQPINGNIGLTMRPSSGSGAHGALSNAGQMMMQSSNKKMSQNQQTRTSQNNFNY